MKHLEQSEDASGAHPWLRGILDRNGKLFQFHPEEDLGAVAARWDEQFQSCAPHEVVAVYRTRQAPPPPSARVASQEALTLAVQTILGLVDQQAMPDEWWKESLAKIRAALATAQGQDA